MAAETLRLAGVARGAPLTILVDGREVAAFAGESIATALWTAGLRRIRASPGGAPRGMFCGMGVCQECVVEVEGVAATACQTPVREGLSVRLRLDGPA
jgi:predicted molibdopterin-dependent oxidoreductase YjgC